MYTLGQSPEPKFARTCQIFAAVQIFLAVGLLVVVFINLDGNEPLEQAGSLPDDPDSEIQRKIRENYGEELVQVGDSFVLKSELNRRWKSKPKPRMPQPRAFVRPRYIWDQYPANGRFRVAYKELETNGQPFIFSCETDNSQHSV